MKIVFTGGGSGGHFYPTIAVAQEIHRLSEKRRLLSPQLYYIGPTPYDARALYENGIVFRKSPAGKMRHYFSVRNFFDVFRTAVGILKSIVQLFFIYPDVVFSKGGYASFPTLVAARALRIPVIIHESDAVPGRVNRWAGKFAKRIAISYPESASAFDTAHVALTGNPVRHELFTIASEGGAEFLDLGTEVPTIFIWGGSQGAARINDAVIDVLPALVERYQIIHQTGEGHIEEMRNTAKVVLAGHPYQLRYKPFGFLDALKLRMVAGAASLIVSRAGSGSIFEIALWGVPSIIIPIPEAVSHDQRRNAFSYARSGGAVVIEENNLSSHLLLSEINRLIENKDLLAKMGKAAKGFAKPDAARVIAEEVIELALSHEPTEE